MPIDPSYDELLKNSAELQHVTIQLVEQVTKMTERMDRILSLFEEAARNIEHAEPQEPLVKKLEELLEQNKIIARGLVLIERYIRDKTSIGFSPSAFEPKKLPRV